MQKVNIYGIEFNAADGEPSDFDYFIEGKVKANDTGEMGMVKEMQAFIRVINQRDLMNLVDVGALFGVFSLIFTKDSGATAFAIEPSPEAFKGLEANCAANPDRHIKPLNLFAGEKIGDLIECGLDWKHYVAHSYLEREGRVTVTTTAVDDIPSITACDCIKIDVEGFECSVLRGAKKTIAKFRPILFLEAHLQSLTPKGETPEGLFSLLTDYGYRVCKLDDTPIESFNGYSHARVICYPVFMLNKKVEK